MNENQVLIGSIPRNSTISIVTATVDTKAGARLDIRQYCMAADGPRPTTRGVRLAMRDAGKLVQHIQQAIEAAQGGAENG